MKPLLFLDMDGVLFGQYGEPTCSQLRPGVGSFLRWVHEHFDLWWSSGWPPEAIQQVSKLLYWPEVDLEKCKPYGTSKRRYVTQVLRGWTPAYWVWVEDEDFTDLQKSLERYASGRCLHVSNVGRDELEKVRHTLEGLLSHAH